MIKDQAIAMEIANILLYYYCCLLKHTLDCFLVPTGRLIGEFHQDLGGPEAWGSCPWGLLICPNDN